MTAAAIVAATVWAQAWAVAVAITAVCAAVAAVAAALRTPLGRPARWVWHTLTSELSDDYWARHRTVAHEAAQEALGEAVADAVVSVSAEVGGVRERVSVAEIRIDRHDDALATIDQRLTALEGDAA